MNGNMIIAKAMGFGSTRRTTQMTEHPLTDKFLTQFGMPTDEFLIQFGIPDDQCVEGERVFFEEDMRAAYDEGRNDQ